MRDCELIKDFQIKEREREKSVGRNEERELSEKYKMEERKGLRKSRTHLFLDFLTCLVFSFKFLNY